MKDNVNLYTYVANSPVMYTDRMGLTGKPIMLIWYSSYIAWSDSNWEYLYNFTSGISQTDVINDLKKIREYGTYTSLISIPFFFFPATVPVGVGIAAGAGGTSIVAWWVESYITETYTPVTTELLSTISWPIWGKILKQFWILSKVEFSTDAMRYMWYYAENTYGFMASQISRMSYGISESVEQVIWFSMSKVLPN
jgi:hypothetical protein